MRRILVFWGGFPVCLLNKHGKEGQGWQLTIVHPDHAIFCDCDCHRSGVSTGGGGFGTGELSIIGVVRAPVAIINFASNLVKISELYRIQQGAPAQKRKVNHCNRCTHYPQLLRFPPLTETPLCLAAPKSLTAEIARDFSAKSRSFCGNSAFSL